ncbi:MAG: hypothetical protein ACFBSE_19975 [Prochloraceae cyanobacterium]
MIDRDLESRQEQEKIQADSNGSQQLENLQNLEKRAKISHKFRTAPPLLRFVNTETVAFLFNIRVEQIYRIECWQHVVYVHGEGVSRFVSYADFPPVIETQKPDEKEFSRWQKRWHKQSKTKIASEFWVKFYTQKFIEAKSQYELRQWGELIAVVKFLFEEVNIERLRENYSYQRFLKLKILL